MPLVSVMKGDKALTTLQDEPETMMLSDKRTPSQRSAYCMGPFIGTSRLGDLEEETVR